MIRCLCIAATAAALHIKSLSCPYFKRINDLFRFIFYFRRLLDGWVAV